jgi:hypothetical protein
MLGDGRKIGKEDNIFSVAGTGSIHPSATQKKCPPPFLFTQYGRQSLWL